MSSATFPLWAWLVFVGLVLGLLFLDLFVLHREAREIPFSEALWLSGLWIAISLAFAMFVGYVGGTVAAEEYLAAYLIEKSLSVDNVFVFSVIFTSFAVPRKYRYHVLFWGVIGAIVFRAVFVLAGVGLLSAFTWLVFVFGAFLIFTGIRMFRHDDGSDEQPDYSNNRVLRLFRRVVPVTDDYHGDNFFVKRVGKRYATPLLATLVVIEASDVIFAVDSVPAVLAVTQNTFVAYSSIVFAVLGLRALYFALEGLVGRFVYLQYGLAFVLVFVGTKLVVEGFGLHVPVLASLLVIVVSVAVSVVASLIATRGGRSGMGQETSNPQESSTPRIERTRS